MGLYSIISRSCSSPFLPNYPSVPYRSHTLLTLPPFQFTNAIYILNADSANPSSIYIYDAAAKSWSKQAVDAGKFDPTNFAAILDHDTNVFCGLTT